MRLSKLTNVCHLILVQKLTCPSDSVDVFLDVSREVEVEYVRDVGDINTPDIKVAIKKNIQVYLFGREYRY